MKRCIINFGRDGRERYSKGQKRLEESIEGENRIFRQEYPKGCPDTKEVSHIFKAYMFKEAFSKGYDSVLWLDASAIVLKDLTPVWQAIEDDGYFFIDSNGCPQAMWTSENQLSAMGCTVKEAEMFTMCRSGMVGLSIKNEHLIDWMLQLPPIAYNGDDKSSSLLFKEARHDQAIFSYIIYKYKMYKHPHLLARYSNEEDIGMAFVEFKGM